MILVKVGKIGARVAEYALNEEVTVGDALNAASLTLSPHEELTLNGEICYDREDEINNGDIVLIRTKPQPKTFEEEPLHTRIAIVIWNVAHAADIKAAERIVERNIELFRR